MKRSDILRINLAAGLIAGALLGIGEIVFMEIRERIEAKSAAEHAEEIAKIAADGTGD